MRKLGKKFWTAMILFGLVGQVAWVVENMYLNVFIYKMFHAQPADISLMVGASSVAATVTTILIGALSDRSFWIGSNGRVDTDLREYIKSSNIGNQFGDCIGLHHDLFWFGSKRCGIQCMADG